MKLYLQSYQDALFTHLFSSEESSNEGNNLEVFCFFLVCTICESHDDTFEYNSEDDSSGDKWRVSHTVTDIGIPRTILEFGRCFISGFTAGRSLRSQ